VLMKRAFNNYK